MERRGQKGNGPVLVVRVRFEPSRLAGDCLAAAYEHVAPIRRRELPVLGGGEHREPNRTVGREARAW